MAAHKKSSGNKPPANIEQNLWDLGDDEDSQDLTANSTPETPENESESAETTVSEEIPDSPALTEETPQVLKTIENGDTASEKTGKKELSTKSSEQLEPIPAEKENSQKKNSGDDFDEISEEDPDHYEHTLGDEEELADEVVKKTPDADGKKSPPTNIFAFLAQLPFLKRLNATEKTCLGLFLLLLFGFVTWLVFSFTPPNSWIKEKPHPVNFPVQAGTITITNVRTAWREPVRSGEARDRNVRLDTRLIPLADITLGGQGSGQLRFIFQNAEGAIIGDTFTETITNGHFKNGQSEMEIHSTDGFIDSDLFNNYAQQEIRPWTLSIYDVTDQKTAGQALLTIPIDATLK